MFFLVCLRGVKEYSLWRETSLFQVISPVVNKVSCIIPMQEDQSPFIASPLVIHYQSSDPFTRVYINVTQGLAIPSAKVSCGFTDV